MDGRQTQTQWWAERTPSIRREKEDIQERHSYDKNDAAVVFLSRHIQPVPPGPWDDEVIRGVLVPK